MDERDKEEYIVDCCVAYALEPCDGFDMLRKPGLRLHGTRFTQLHVIKPAISGDDA